MTFDDVRKFALTWPEVEDGTSYGTPALKVRKKLLARLKEDGDSLVMPDVPIDERAMLVESQPKIFYFTDHYADYPMVLIRLSKARRATVEPLLRRRWRALASKAARANFDARERVTHAMDQDRFLALALKNPINVAILDELQRLALPDAWLVSGCLVQTAWNVLTGRAIDHGIADYDVFYFDPDTSWDAEDTVIRKLQARLGHLGVKIETRNQARVHLWYPAKHGLPYPPLSCSTDGIDRFLTQNTQIGVRRSDDGHEVYAPHGFDDVERLIVRPNPALNFSEANYAAKATRWKALWPEITVIAAE